MTLGSTVRTQVRNIINNPNFRTTITHTSQTVSLDTGGYSGATVTQTGATSIYAVPYGYFKNKTNFHVSGDVDTGDVLLVVADNVTINPTDSITYNGEQFNVRRVKPIPFNELIMAQIIVLSKELT